MTRLKLIAATVAVIVVIGAGMFLLRAPQPHIVLAPEAIFEIGGLTVVNTMITAWVITIFLVSVSLLATRNMKLVPGGLQNAVEAGVDAFYGLVKGVAGDSKARLFLPVAGTIFFFIALSNWAGLLPVFGSIGKFEDAEHVLDHQIHNEEEAGHVNLVKFQASGLNLIGINPDTVEVDYTETDATFEGSDGEEHVVTFAADADSHDKAVAIEQALEEAGHDPGELGHLLPLFRSANTDLTVPLAMALVSFVFIEFCAFRALGFRYLGKFFNFKSPISLLVGLLEFFGEFIRIISLTFRLFGNTVAGEVLLIMVVFLAPLLVVQIFYGLELMFALIQAFIFSILTVVFASMAMESHDAHAAGHGQADGDNAEPGHEAAGAHGGHR
ncbi:MAG: hypothetical protein GEU28_00735 [Dehalococcoidia bacterium]|nr:hypothetical protein [Dehalococcoidia bacterium]